jgi:hypothetical protein
MRTVDDAKFLDAQPPRRPNTVEQAALRSERLVVKLPDADLVAKPSPGRVLGLTGIREVDSG